MKEYRLTKEGYDNLLKELDDLVKNKRKEIAEILKEAKEFGDLSENAEYAEAKDAQALNEGKVFYTPTRGIPELLEAIAEKLQNENRIPATSDNIIVTPGAKYAIFEAIMATIEKGDEVILLDPSWVSYEPCILMAEGKPVWVDHG